MAISLFSKDYFAGGEPVASGAAASLMAAEGAALAKKIEAISQKNEAQAKAPVLATAYADAYTRIAGGDFTGFASLGKAQAEAMGNPFLMSMMDDATKEAGRLASSFLESQLADKRIAAQEAIVDKRIASQEAIADKRIALQNDQQNNLMDRQQEMQLAQFDRQSEDDYRAQVAKLENEHQQKLYQWQQDQQAENRKAQLEGRAPQQIPQPEKPAMPPKPTPRSKTFGGAGVQGQDPNLPAQGSPSIPASSSSSAPLVNENNEATRLQAQNPKPNPREIEGDSGLFNTSVGDNPLPATGVPPASGIDPSDSFSKFVDAPVGQGLSELPAEKDPRSQAQIEGQPKPAAAQPAPKPSKPNTTVRTFGGLAFEIPEVAPTKGVATSETVKTSTGSKTYTLKDDEKPQNKFADALANIEGESPAFAQWYSEQFQANRKVDVRPYGDAKNKQYVAVSIKPDRTEEMYGKRDANQQPTGEVQPISESLYKNFKEAQGLLNGDLKGKVGIFINKSPEVQEKTKEATIKAILAGRISFEEAQKKLAMMRVELTKEEIDKQKRKKEGMQDYLQNEGLTGVGNYSPFAGLSFRP